MSGRLSASDTPVCSSTGLLKIARTAAILLASDGVQHRLAEDNSVQVRVRCSDRFQSGKLCGVFHGISKYSLADDPTADY